MSTIIRGSGDTTFGGTIQSTGIDDNATSTAITIDASENVGIGTSLPSGKLEVAMVSALGSPSFSGGTDFIHLLATAGSGYAEPAIKFQEAGSDIGCVIAGKNTQNGAMDIVFANRDTSSATSTLTERMRIDSSGNVLVGTTDVDGEVGSSSFSGLAFAARKAYGLRVTTSESNYWNRIGDGAVHQLRRSGTTVGSIAVQTGGYIGFGSSGCGLYFGANQILPTDSNPLSGADNLIDLGRSSTRFDDIYATNGTIQTSDRNEKQDIEALSDAEQRVAIACKGLMRKFRWIDAVAEKGDDARIHFGIIAQDLQDAFAAEGLDAGRYAMFISSTWYEKLVPVDAVEAVEAVEATYDDEGNELTPAVEAVEAKDAYTRTDTKDEPTAGYTERTRLGVRYPELLAFIISAI